MRVWLIKDGEYLPIQAEGRAMRTGMLAQALAARGHDVVWWHSTFSHQTKQKVADGNREIEIAPRYRLHLLEAGTYSRNYSLARMRHHRRLARAFSRAAAAAAPPDLIVCAFPVIEAAAEAVSFARRRRIPVVVDVRDYWPDTFASKAPPALRPLVSLLLGDLNRQARSVFRKADGLVSMSSAMLGWALAKGGRHNGSNTAVIPIGAEDFTAPESPRPEIADLLVAAQGRTLFVFGGTMGRFYDLGTVAATAEALWREGRRDAHFILAGAGEQWEAVKAVANRVGNLAAPGWLSADDYRALLAGADVGILPYAAPDYEAFPNKVFEYFAASVAVLSSCSGEVERVLQDNDAGLHYRFDLTEACRSAVLALVDDTPRRKRMGENARRLFQERYSAEICYLQYADFIDSLMAGKRTGSAFRL